MSINSTSQIQERLAASFDNVKPIQELDPNILEDAAYARIASVFTFEGLTFCVGAFTLDKDIVNGKYTRYVVISKRLKSLVYHF